MPIGPAMLRFRPAMLLVFVAAAGCWPHALQLRPPAKPPAPAQSAQSAGFVLRTTLLDRPAGDEYLARGLWDAATQPLPHELAARLSRNGVRVGVIAGVLPGEFAGLVATEGALLDPTDRHCPLGEARVVPVCGPVPEAALDYRADVAATGQPLRLTEAEGGLAVRPTAEAGRVKLSCGFQLQHGARQSFLKPTEDGSQFTQRSQKALERLAELDFAVTVGEGDYLLVGATEAPAGTLGGVLFVEPSAARPRQRVLLVRAFGGAGRPGGGRPAEPASSGSVTAGRAETRP